MWNVQGKAMAPGQVMGYDHAVSDANMHSKNANTQFSGSGFNDQYVDKELNRRSESLSGISILQNVPSPLQSVNQIVNQPGSFPSTACVFNKSFSQSQLSRIQDDGVFRNQNPHSSQEKRSSLQQSAYSQYPINSFPANSQALNIDSQKAVAGSSVDRNFTAGEPPSTSSAAVIEIPRLPYSQHFTYNVLGQGELNNSQPVANTAGYLENIQGNHVSRSEMRAHTPTHLFGATMPLDSSVMSSKDSVQHRESPREVHLSNTNPDMKIHTQGQGLLNTENMTESEKNKNMFDVARSLNALLCQTNLIVTSIGSAERGKMSLSSKNEIKLTNDLSASIPGDEPHGSHHNEETSPKIMATSGGISQPTVQAVSLNNQLSSHGGEALEANVSTSTTTTGKIWDGIIQLNTSTTVSAVAYFKSGEKFLDISWPHFIEVKGKVRLEAFEKFIQELPRSRSRALMVISICWKIGSSETGLTGIKEVAKVYKDVQRVGFAHLCPGMDLYVCPRSETIITILAKYGFFKGMAAVVEDQDSLIGCVVWRRNHSNPTAISKDSDTTKFPLDKNLNSPPESNLQTASMETKDSENKPDTVVPKMDPATAPAVQIASAVPSFESRSTSRSLVVSSSMIIPSTGSTTVPVSVDRANVHQDGPAIPAEPSNIGYFVSPLQACVAQLPRDEASVSFASAPKKPRLNANDNGPTFSGTTWLQHETKVGGKCAEDDDLPEFDFDIACGTGAPKSGSCIPSSNQQGNMSARPVVRHPPSGDGGTPVKAVMKPELSSMQQPPFPSWIHQGTQPQGKVASANLERNDAARSAETPLNPTLSREHEVLVNQANACSKGSLWDDDDMPEWCPPDIDHAHQPSQPRAPPQPLLARRPPELDQQPRYPPPPPPPPAPFLHHPPEFNRQPQMPPPLPLLCPPAMAPPGLHSPLNRRSSDTASRAPFMSNAIEQNLEVYGRETTNHSPSLSAQLPSSSYFHFDQRHSPAHNNSNSSLGHLHGGFDMRHEKRPVGSSHSETARRQQGGYERGVPSPRQRYSEITRRRPTWFDVFPDNSRASPPRRTRRRPSLFDVMPGDSGPSGGRR